VTFRLADSESSPIICLLLNATRKVAQYRVLMGRALKHLMTTKMRNVNCGLSSMHCFWARGNIGST